MYTQLSDRIRTARRTMHWSQAELASKLAVHASAVGHWERGAGNRPSSERLFELARLTGVNAQWLAVGSGSMHADTATDAATALPALCRDEEYLLRCFRRLSVDSRAYLLRFAEHQTSAA
ncbi:MAG: transcriptional regulator [Gammaproteobacteria bacterium HGW-Gammaproteobacteria-6]|jgi:transcriptional regulator with XRE-family HTH domain|nr:MAG: transcriptional regulator [Gammaproteobacteria bacterium HGW-Gammaproteobacteria-6]PKM16676.1 MAG: transcriptional regulator [Gammaproteobacteria bacterium HGW-Gammaproteobacteria-2]